MRALIAGNWKMNGLGDDAKALAEALKGLAEGGQPACDLLVCPPFPYLGLVAQALAGSRIAVGGQDCHGATSGAHTGDTAAPMLRDIGCSYVIVGHSERRADYGETDAQVRAKAEVALAAGLVPIVCVGETEKERNAEQTLAVIARQVKGSVPAGMEAGRPVVAYEPVWAIGPARTATPAARPRGPRPLALVPRRRDWIRARPARSEGTRFGGRVRAAGSRAGEA